MYSSRPKYQSIYSPSAQPERAVKLLKDLRGCLATVGQYYKLDVDVVEHALCVHCTSDKKLSYNPYTFTMRECRRAAEQQSPYLRCRQVHLVRIDRLVPDLLPANSISR